MGVNSGLHVPPGFPDSTCAIVQATNNTNNSIAHLAGWAMVRSWATNNTAAVVFPMLVVVVCGAVVIVVAVVVVVVGGRC